MVHTGKTLQDKINLQQVASKTTFVWPLNERRYTTERTSWWVKLCSDGALWHWCCNLMILLLVCISVFLNCKMKLYDFMLIEMLVHLNCLTFMYYDLWVLVGLGNYGLKYMVTKTCRSGVRIKEMGSLLEKRQWNQPPFPLNPFNDQKLQIIPISLSFYFSLFLLKKSLLL